MSIQLKENHTITAQQEENPLLSIINDHDSQLFKYFSDKFLPQSYLTRQHVSFQANKKRFFYRWYKYKEAFSASLIEHLLSYYKVVNGKILDPFAGSGTALFAASELGLDADGIEVLPIGQQIILTRDYIENGFSSDDLIILKKWKNNYPWKDVKEKHSLNEFRITKGAYPIEAIDALERYLWAIRQERDGIQRILRFALLCVLESISFTRKDGQYLRWDYRSGRQQGKKMFDKGKIFNFDEAINTKIDEIVFDLENSTEPNGLFTEKISKGNINLLSGSCLDIMQTLSECTYDAIITSPPYCNRYDYTRTYALELALLGVNEAELTMLRQQMLSCTVENRPKDLLTIGKEWNKAIAIADEEPLLQAILHYLEEEKGQNHLNNNGIPRMVRGYFYEMACIIFECARVMKPNALLFMVNDNVRYAGASISVDMILSDVAEKMGFSIENILVLPNEKGNSSQQMGLHGRDPLRKCVYVWRKI